VALDPAKEEREKKCLRLFLSWVFFVLLWIHKESLTHIMPYTFLVCISFK
jgi:hypothetical protein